MDLRKARQQARLSQAQVAKAANVSVGTISTLERGIHRPQPATARKLERLFGQVLTFTAEVETAN
ncbi:MAG: helix-turn-helix transcriptional regulator [Desulfobacter postgatei]|uniref:helix-turn-helix domain-containing protein n=1 Tax=Desulfobacter postgatei TaxID=2293 RepID=UPI0023F0FAB4|nr:helix-turn-helix transcriptional regulator [Desulfobacter postgatei]MDD4274276.1 helix-turn-helix transcriptional regulator [Desulfobacter postgatei]